MNYRFSSIRISYGVTLIAMLLFASNSARAQYGVSSMGTDFWLGFMPNGAGAGNSNVYEELFFASSTANKVTISGPVSRTFKLTAGQVYDVPLTDVMNSTDETVEDDAIHITSTNPITVYGYSAWGNPQGIGDSPDGFLALPTEALGTEYYTVNFPDNYVFGQMPGEFLITSPYNNNVITITPAATTKAGRPAGVAWSVTLQQGQTYLVQSPGNNFGANDLTGTLIKSSKPISVLTGHQITSVPSDCGCYSADNLFEMVPSVDKWGTQYFDMPMAGKLIAGDYIRILSAENGNQIQAVNADSTKSITLDSGQYQDFQQVVNATAFTSTNHKRFIVAQYSYSQGTYGDPGYSDPFLVLFTPKEQFEKDMIFRTPTAQKGAFTNYATIIAPEDSISKVTINGLPLSAFPSAGNATFPGTTPLMGARRILLDSKPYNYIAKGPVPFAMYQYGFSDYAGYGWPSGMLQRITNSTDTLPPIAQTLSESECGTRSLKFSEPRTNDTRLAEVAMITASGDPRWPEPSYNYRFAQSTGFTPGATLDTVSLTVIDPTQDAYAAIDAVDRAGNDSIFQCSYHAPVLRPANGSGFDFGTMLAGTDSCLMFSWMNKDLSGRLSLSNVTILGDTSIFKASVFTEPLVLSSGESALQGLCVNGGDTGDIFDTLLVQVNGCAEFRYPLHVTIVTPLIDASDVDFGSVPVGDTICKRLVIRDPGNAPLTIYPSILLRDTVNFSISASLPVTIMPGSSMTLSVCFHPRTSGSIELPIAWRTNIDTTYQHSLKDTSFLNGVGVALGVAPQVQDRSFALSIAPNPVSHVALISISGAPSANVEIFDVLGREVASFRVDGSYQWRMGALPAGTYIVRAEASGTLASRRLVKQ